MPLLLHTRFLGAAATSPGRVAVAPRGRGVTYGHLAEMSRRAAARLESLASRGDRVALLSESTPEYVAALYGAWMAGQAAVALNPALRSDELARLVSHAQASTLVCDARHPEVGSLRDRLPANVAIVDLEQLFEPLAEQDALPPEIEPAPDDLAMIVYTSGTTGHPKGVMLTHGNLAANTAAIQASLPVRPDDRALCVLPFQYSYGSSVLHTHLTVGATVLVERSLMYPHQVLGRIADEQVTSFAGVPSTFYLLLDRTDLSAYDLSSLRYVTQAGGRMDPRRIREFREAVPDVDFYVMYGQTEASARLSCLPAGDLERRVGSAGLPIPGVELEIRGDDGRPAPRGETGEVWASGENVMRGYWGDPEETSKVLFDGWLRTGDLGRMDEEGYLYLEGRSREMIKSGAYRIAPAEVEEVIRDVPGIIDVAVVGAEDPVLGEAIYAHVVARSPGKEVERAIMRACTDRLARYKLPKEILFRPSLPQTASGKVRKHLLRAP